ncbi:MAG: GntR family transcriptional regulator [Parasporobacterium sp.]|nr:GntR family transcriptional regulator [Parasporobacterium sp.]
MLIEIDFNSEEAIYVQLRNQIIVAIATSQLKNGESLPSVRNMADDIGVNMHTVNKAYSSLRQDGFLKVDRRRGAVVSVDIDKINSLNKMRCLLKPLIASGIVKGVSRDEVKKLIDEIYDDME